MTSTDLADDLAALAPDLRGIDAQVADRLFRDARTVGRFLDRDVPDALVREVHDVVRWGPTALNTVPLRLLLVRSPQGRARLATHMSEGNRERVLAAPLTVVVAADADFHQHMSRLTPHAAHLADVFAADPQGRERAARDNTWLQAGYLVVGLRAAGLGVGPMGGFDPAGIDDDLLAGTGWRSLLVLNVGWPDGPGTHHARAPRLEWDEVARTV
ncbi:malonic semialdehyde reductase [Cellulomonas shaoxiangyii]|uniref:Malonic semialdehyde reductase n=1 Tax=Cellulomonas shaoxiangyii TaxID=2566013 RepID=A0A4V1CMH4_9CELL|nr:malonic semialdehyde reductase [Cellulomonas shaoxiangyii]QCB92955.1 malonic semialdehyde reductase [Cellulomonas shaoxiangyii]TGY79883.1 malonic semialdehyde reductase [Cellulomonas shaoxiangyii]